MTFLEMNSSIFSNSKPESMAPYRLPNQHHFRKIPMIERRPFSSPWAGANNGLGSRQAPFSFAAYQRYKPHGLGRAARVDMTTHRPPITGFPAQIRNADWKIITYVRSARITHQDNLGNRGRTRLGDVAG